MNKPTQPPLTKACMNCGLQKPLSAFLEMSGTQGTAYGNTCSSCRKTALEDAGRRKTEAEGSTTSETGHNIDSKTKVHSAIDQREQWQRKEDSYHEDRKDDEVIANELKITKQQTETSHQKHKDNFLKKRSFLSGDNKKLDVTRVAAQTQTQTANARTELDKQAAGQHGQDMLDDRKKTGIDFTVANTGQQVAGQLRFSGQTFQQFRQWLGNAAPIVNNLSQTQKDAAPKNAGAVAQPVKKMTEKETHPEKDPIEIIEKYWRPGTKR